jgi:putative endonuclease
MEKTTRNHYRIDIGKWGEDYACQYLTVNGLQLIDRNVRTPYGEIDLVMEMTGITVFVEVKTRSNKESGYPEDSVTEDKMDHMNECAQWFMDDHKNNDDPWRVDVVAVIGQPKKGIPQIEWFQNEF